MQSCILLLLVQEGTVSIHLVSLVLRSAADAVWFGKVCLTVPRITILVRIVSPV